MGNWKSSESRRKTNEFLTISLKINFLSWMLILRTFFFCLSLNLICMTMIPKRIHAAALRKWKKSTKPPKRNQGSLINELFLASFSPLFISFHQGLSLRRGKKCKLKIVLEIVSGDFSSMFYWNYLTEHISGCRFLFISGLFCVFYLYLIINIFLISASIGMPFDGN